LGRKGKLLVALFLAWAAVQATADEGPAAPQVTQPPKPTGLMETVEKRLVQFDVGVEGDPAAIRAITAKDFVLYVGEHEVTGLIVDRLCSNEPPAIASPEEDHAAETPPPVVATKFARPRATFIFFFDQPHLTQIGRLRSLETSRDLINRLVVDGSRASIVSNAKRLQTIVPLTGDRQKLLDGLEKLRNDPTQWDSHSDSEQARAEEVVDAYRWRKGVSPNDCLPLLARAYAAEEWQEARRSTERLGITVGALAEMPAPKALVYFGDSLREKAGLHYLHVPPCKQSPEVQSAEIVPSAAAEFDAVINEALARGVHFFTIQAEGLVPVGFSVATSSGWNTGPGSKERRGWDAERHHQAEDALVGLAAETGGEAFLGGASRDFIAARIAARTSCALLLSFPPGDLPRDKPLSITLELHVPTVKYQTQGRIVIPSPGSIERARLLAAFANPESSDDGSLRVLLIPRGGDGKTWQASLQLRLRPSGIPDTSVELGASIVRQERVRDQFASSIAARSGARAIVLEKRLDISPGAFSVVAVSRDVNRSDVASNRLDANWPNPAKSTAAIAPIAVLQADPAAMSKDGVVSSSGALARDVDEMLDPSASVTLESVVCRGAKSTGPIVVERWLEDGLPNAFAPMTIAETDDPCVQTVDVVPAGRLRPGVVDYRVVARVGDEIVAQERRALRVGAVPGSR
jgi:hypothetical protein